jgi:hypothetical protein
MSSPQMTDVTKEAFILADIDGGAPSATADARPMPNPCNFNDKSLVDASSKE